MKDSTTTAEEMGTNDAYDDNNLDDTFVENDDRYDNVYDNTTQGVQKQERYKMNKDGSFVSSPPSAFIDNNEVENSSVRYPPMVRNSGSGNRFRARKVFRRASGKRLRKKSNHVYVSARPQQRCRAK